MDKRSVLVELITLCAVCLLAACSGGVPAPEHPPLKVAWAHRTGDYTLVLAQQMGFFEQFGIEVEPIEYSVFSRAIPDIAGAKLDGGLLTIGEAILATNATDIKGVMVYDSGGIYSVVASPEVASIASLRGKRIGVNLHTSSEMYVSYMLERALLNSRDVFFIEMSPEQVAQGIPDQVDAGVVWEPYTTEALRQGNKLLYSSDRYSTLIPNLIVFRRAVVEQRPDDIRAFLLAWDAAVKYRLQYPQESLLLISQATGLPVNQIMISEDTTLYTLEDNLGLFEDNPGSDAGSIYYIARFNLDFLIVIGDITSPPDLGSILDPSFLK